MKLFPYNKPFSVGMVLFFWIPALLILLVAIRFWWITLILLFIVASFANGAALSRENKAQELESEFSTRQINRNVEKLRLLRAIGAPDMPSGDYSDEKTAQWDVFHQLDAEDQRLTTEERNALVNAGGA